MRCEAITLASVLDKYNIPKQFDLLCIDVEGHELEVLKSINFSTHRPKLIVVEMHDFKIDSSQNTPVHAYLTANGYCMQSYLKPNGFYTTGTIND